MKNILQRTNYIDFEKVFFLLSTQILHHSLSFG